MKIKYYLLFLMLTILAIMLMGAAASLSLKASGLGPNSGVNKLEFHDIKEDISFDPAYGADNGFVVNPYQGDNPEQSQALIIGASVSYILKEVKAFTMFAVALAVVALIAYVTIAYIILNRIVRPIVRAEELRKNEELRMRNEENADNVNNKESGSCFEDPNCSAAFLSRNIDEMLAEIDKVMEKSKVKWSILL
ncbi:MAG: hypothetical protein LBC52_00395 [Treponema sp.]|nr:hypothetical protein [Treponema sp.]